MKKMLQRIAQSCLEFDVSDRTVHCMQKSRQELCKFTSSSQDLSIIYLRVVNSHQFNQSDLDTRSWYHGMAASKECLQAPLHTPSSPDRSRLAPLVLDYTRLSRPKPNREPVRRLTKLLQVKKHALLVARGKGLKRPENNPLETGKAASFIV